MELNTEGFYKKPRFLSGFKFLSHITETRKCGNRMPVYFPARGSIDVIDYRLNPNDRFDCSVLFLAPLGKDDIWVEDIEEWEFVQYRPNTQWTAIKIETEEEDDMTPLVTETIPSGTYFKMLLNSIYGKNYFCVMIEGGNGNFYEALYTDFADIKDQLRAEGVKKVVVSGVEKELKRVSEISSGLLHLVFAYDGELEHFYSTKNTRLRVREGKIATEYLLDHVKRMHV